MKDNGQPNIKTFTTNIENPNVKKYGSKQKYNQEILSNFLHTLKKVWYFDIVAALSILRSVFLPILYLESILTFAMLLTDEREELSLYYIGIFIFTVFNFAFGWVNIGSTATFFLGTGIVVWSWATQSRYNDWGSGKQDTTYFSVELDSKNK